jgi:nicotinate-nucleotide adenylyltransferase
MRIGVFGGAFDPPHTAHRALVEAALAQLDLDHLRIVPTGLAWHKSRALSPGEHRLAMARLAFADLSQVVVDPREMRRAGPSYTVDTLRELQAENPGAALHLIIGQDQAAALPTWREWEQVVRLAIICVAARPDLTGSERQFVPPPELGHCYRQLNFPHLPVSATDIRQRFASGQGVVPLVCDAVARYIVDHHLYPSA